ncbi:MAG: hypothetical protein HPY53_01335 [Brevinematales bacterium]|nr:hypothetical protein [Brevinematales bacterium]
MEQDKTLKTYRALTVQTEIAPGIRLLDMVWLAAAIFVFLFLRNYIILAILGASFTVALGIIYIRFRNVNPEGIVNHFMKHMGYIRNNFLPPGKKITNIHYQ